MQQQSLNNAIIFCLFIDLTISFTVHLEVELPHCQGWKGSWQFCAFCSEVSWQRGRTLKTWSFLGLNVLDNGDPTMFSHISHLFQVQYAIAMASVKCCGAQCSENDAISTCFRVVEALDLARNREEKRQWMERVKLWILEDAKKNKKGNSLHVPTHT